MFRGKRVIAYFLDVFIVVVAYWLGFYFRFFKYGVFFNTRGFVFGNYLILFSVFLSFWLLLSFMLKIYRYMYGSRESLVRIIVLDIANLFVVGTFCFYYNKIYSFSRAFIMIASGLTVVFHVGFRWGYTSVRMRKIRLKYLHKKKRLLQQPHNIMKKYQVSLILSDIIVISLAFIVGFYIRFYADIFYPPRKIAVFSEQIYKLWFLNAIYIAFYFIYNLYKVNYRSVFEIVWNVFKSNFLSILFIVFLSYFSNTRYKTEWAGVILVAGFIIYLLGVFIRYVIWRAYRRYNLELKENILIIGAGKTGVMVSNRLKQALYRNKKVVGFLDDNPYLQSKLINDIPVLGTLDDLERVIKEKEINSVIVAIPGLAREKLSKIIKTCNMLLIPFKLTSDVFAIVLSSLEVAEYEGLMLLTLKKSPLERMINRVVKRAFDIVASSIFLILTAPLMLLIAFLIKMTSRGPVFYLQDRLTQNRRPFKAIKFRTMYIDKKFDSPWTEENDPRITKIGRLLRKTSLDELPQLINILKGDMSIVGPRALAAEDEKYFDSPFFRLRYKVKAGLTGWAQVHGLRGGHRFIEERTRFDLWYIENWSLFLDIKIIFMTISEVLFGSNAY